MATTELPVSRSARRLLLPYGAALVVVVGLLPLEQHLDPAEVASALVLLVAAGAGLAASAFGRQRRGTTLASLFAMLAATFLLREGVGPSAGFGPLLLMPVMWAALARHRTQLVLVLVGVAVVFFVPILVASDTHPSSGWRAGALMLVVAAALGFSVLSLVEHLRSVVGRSGAILGAMSEGFALTRDGAIIQVNPALTAITGFAEHQLVGATVPFPFWPADSWERNAELVARVVADGGGAFDIELVRADGTRFPAVISCVPTDLGDGSRSFLNTVRDVTELRAHEAAQRHHAERLATIADVVREIGHCDPLEARPAICRTALALLDGADAACLWESGRDADLTSTAARPEAGTPYRVAADAHEHGARVTMDSGQPLFVADAASSPHCDRRLVSQLGAASVLFHPIADSGGVRGVLAISWPRRREAIDDGEMMMIGVLAGEAALAMQRADLLGRLDELTRTDDLTGLPNRRAWDELLRQELAVAERQGQPLSVAMLDLDHFKAYNDRHGHLAGDRLLRAAAAVWSGSLRATDVLARWGGEEFALLLPACDTVGATALIERLRGTLPDGVTFSAGLVTSPGGEEPGALMDAADRALYQAKAAGRDRVVSA
ncbi:MAG TPA: diguanylate cyclase [Baekduia sp.]|uniref:sensor domain-containing diguanylate cyclase n=1 Tax=Baekduia sp. TaxID=2600305 RepID=UPI002D7919D5|nr:diguanylate cyclase [Baekduia sp.]HET6510163.1 diguanylate cyclase [Baekduia sp.]